ncbi:MAG: hypothetical protein ACW98I_03730, partial [Candidatus Hodarchaeales archaeon]
MKNYFERKIKSLLTCSAVLCLVIPIFLNAIVIDSVYGANQRTSEADWIAVDTEYSGTYMEFNDIEFFNKTIGWILGEDIILHTSDGGKNWEGHPQYV